MKKVIISAICAAIFAAPVAAERRADYTAKLGPDASVSGGYYSSGGGLTVAADLREYQGKTLVCGVWAISKRQSVLTKHAERTVLGAGSIFVDGKRLVSGLLFMNRVSPAADYTGQQAGCVQTRRAWQSGDETRQAKIRFPRLHVEKSSDDGGFANVYFKQSGPGAGEF